MVSEEHRTEAQLIGEVKALRRQAADAEPSDAGRKRALQDVDSFNEHILRVSPLGISAYRSDGQCVLVNEAIGPMIGATKEQVLSQNFREIESWKISGLLADAEEALSNGTEKRRDVRVMSTFGRWVWLECRMSRFVSAGEPHLLFVANDIHQRKLAEEALRERERRFEDIAENALEWIWEVDAAGKYTYSSPVVKKVLGYELAEILDRHFFDLFHPEDRGRLKEAAFEVFARKQPFREFVNRNIHKNGESVWLSTSGVPVLDEEGNLLGYRGADTDITERKKADEALRESEERYRLLAENATDVIWTTGMDLQPKYLSPSVARLLGYGVEAVMCRRLEEVMTPDSLERVRKVLAEELDREAQDGADPRRSRTLELELNRRDGSRVSVETTASFLRDDSGHAVGILGAARDITEREQAKRDLEQRLRFEKLASTISARFIDLPVADFDAAIEHGLGLVAEFFEVEHAHIAEFLPDRHRWRVSHVWLSEGISDATGFLGGRVIPVEFSGFTRRLQRGEGMVFGSLDELPDDMTEDREFWLKRGIKATVVSPLSVAGKFLGAIMINSYGSERAWPEETGQRLKFLGEIFANAVGRKRAEEERRALEARIHQAQKLESLGVLAGGIAHDFNNLLMGVLGNASVALENMPATHPARKDIEHISSAAKEMADLSRQMLAYSGKGSFVVEPIRLGQVVEEIMHLLKASISKKAILNVDLDPTLPAVEADAAQIRQIVMNLIINASEALGDEGGVISISTGVMECDRTHLEESYLDEARPEGLYAYVEVADTGCGMDRETLERVFDPFFTTKFAGRGLGMSAVLGIVRGHKGVIKIDSEVGRGSTFRVLLPAIGQPDELQTREPTETQERREGGTILVADDEEIVRAVTRRMLEHLGFTVLTASDGGGAVRQFREHADEVTCVLLDLTMPGMGGEETFAELRRIRGDVRVILSSGYLEEDVEARFIGRGLAGFIHKPYTSADLGAKIEQVLGA